jgi:hypothetical protein
MIVTMCMYYRPQLRTLLLVLLGTKLYKRGFMFTCKSSVLIMLLQLHGCCVPDFECGFPL